MEMGAIYTEPVYKSETTGELCRVLDHVFIVEDGLTVEAVLTVNTESKKIVYKKTDFDEVFFLFDAGESPAEILLKSEE